MSHLCLSARCLNASVRVVFFVKFCVYALGENCVVMVMVMDASRPRPVVERCRMFGTRRAYWVCFDAAVKNSLGLQHVVKERDKQSDRCGKMTSWSLFFLSSSSSRSR